jgi:glutaredoxin
MALLLASGMADAQMYKWKDAKGVTHFSDAPPSANQAELKNYGSGAASAALPYELSQAGRANPVTLYTTGGCAPCDQGRALLQKRGIPFAEKTVSSAADQQRLKEAGSDGQLPLLVVGHAKLQGFQSDSWNEALTAAAYPAQSMLPPGFRHAAAAPAAPAQMSQQELAKARAAEREAAASAEAAEQAKFAPRPKAVNGTPDFQF